MRSKYKDKTYGKLTMLHFSRKGGSGVGEVWKAVCECGNVLEVLARKARKGDVTSCGKCRKGLDTVPSSKLVKQGIPEGHRNHFSKLLRTKPGADVNARQYTAMLTNRCVACNIQPVHVEWQNPEKNATDTVLIPICKTCSYYRNEVNLVTWLQQVMRIATNLQRQATLEASDETN